VEPPPEDRRVEPPPEERRVPPREPEARDDPLLDEPLRVLFARELPLRDEALREEAALRELFFAFDVPALRVLLARDEAPLRARDDAPRDEARERPADPAVPGSASCSRSLTVAPAF
jgi:hypothetical protein